MNGRTVADGILYVNGVPLADSPMRHHPLTPMWASSLTQLMEPQGKYPCLCLNSQQLHRPNAEIYREISAFSDKNQKFYIIPDYQSESDGLRVAQLFSHCKVLTGGSGILAPLAQAYLAEATQLPPLQSGTPGRCLLLAGSCSQATLGQIADFQQKGYPSYQIDPIALRNGGDNVQKIWDFVASQGENPVLVYSSDTPENIQINQQQGGHDIAALLESTAAELACRAVASGYTRLIVAGGETSSAVVQRLGFQGFQIGESVSPGVPIMAPLQNKALRVVLKSGNFGQVDFFHRAVLLTKT